MCRLRGGRVPATWFGGGLFLPGNEGGVPPEIRFWREEGEGCGGVSRARVPEPVLTGEGSFNGVYGLLLKVTRSVGQAVPSCQQPSPAKSLKPVRRAFLPLSPHDVPDVPVRCEGSPRGVELRGGWSHEAQPQIQPCAPSTQGWSGKPCPRGQRTADRDTLKQASQPPHRLYGQSVHLNHQEGTAVEAWPEELPGPAVAKEASCLCWAASRWPSHPSQL